MTYMETEKIALRRTCVAVANPDDPEVRSCQMVQNVLLLPPPPNPRNCHSSSIVHDIIIIIIIIIINEIVSVNTQLS
jgi:hypothetical protein